MATDEDRFLYPIRWSEIIDEWEGLCAAEEFEKIRLMGPKISMALHRRQIHLEEHLDKGDLVCKCYTNETDNNNG